MLEGRSLDILNQRLQIYVPSFAPGAVKDVGEQDVLAALERIGLDAEQRQQARKARDFQEADRIRDLLKAQGQAR